MSFRRRNALCHAAHGRPQPPCGCTRASTGADAACVSLWLPQASLGDCQQSLSLVAGKRPEPKAPSVIRFADDTIPGRNHRLLPALAKNMPLACFLNASRLPEGGLFTPCGCTETSKGPMRRFCDGLLPRFRGIQSNPEQPEPPSYAAALQHLRGARGSGGKAPFCFPPGGFPPLSTRESGLMLRLRSAIASNRCRCSRESGCLS